jgi:GT2 family glycosyltransferase
MEVTVIYVNYESADLLRDSVDSLKGTRTPLEIIVVDNNSSSGNRDILSRMQDITFIPLEKNIGFSGACNIGARQSRGRFLFFLNPDTILFGGAIEALIDFLKNTPSAGAAGPRSWWDRGKHLLLLSSEVPSLGSLLSDSLASRSLFYEFFLKKNIMRGVHSLRYRMPYPVKMLPGAAVMIRREVFFDIGMFDEAFPLYFEDADLSKRLGDAGHGIYIVPEAEIVHLYNQSAKHLGDTALRLSEQSSILFAEKHFPGMTSCLLSLSNHIVPHFRHASPEHASILITEAPVFTVEPLHRVKEGIFTISINNYFSPSACGFIDGNSFQFPDTIWKRLQDGVYWTGMFAAPDFSPMKLWRVEKHVAH